MTRHVRRACIHGAAAAFVFLSLAWSTASHAVIDTVDARLDPTTWARSVDSGPQGAGTQVLQTVEITGRREPPPPDPSGVLDNATSHDSGLPSDPSKNQSAKPVANNNSAIDPCAATSHPVVIATGEKFKVEPDFETFKLNGLSLTRTYRSRDMNASLFGRKWMSTYDYFHLVRYGCYTDPDYPGICLPTSVVWNGPDGTSYTYTHTYANVYQVQGSQSMGTLERQDDGSWMVRKGREVYFHTPMGMLERIETQYGALQFTYDPSGYRLMRITNAAGQYIEFAWNAMGNLVTGVRDPAGNTWSYAYNANYMLASVTSPGAQPDVRSYHYEDPSDNSLLTGISINGVRYSTYRYDSSKRVVESGLTGAEERDTFAYGSNQTTVTSAQGQSVVYNFTSVLGALKLSSTSRLPTASCAAAGAQTVYDANGWVDYTLDWNGNKTDYQYDPAGRLLQVTTAAGTASANTKVNVWSGDDITETSWRNSANAAYLKVSYTYSAAIWGGNKLMSETWTDLRTGAQRQTTYSYTAYPNGTLASTTVSRALPGGTASTTTSYDALGNTVSVLNALGQQTTWTNHNGLGQAGRVTDANGVITDRVYDMRGNLLSTTSYLSGGARTTSYAYNHDRQVTQVAHADGRVDRMQYNAAGRLLMVGDTIGDYVRLGLDVASNTATTSSNRYVPSASGPTPTYSMVGEFSASVRRDSLNRPWVQTGNAGQQVSFTYDNNGNVKTRTDAAGRVTRYDYDPQDRLTKLTAADNGITLYGYDTEGRLAYVQDQSTELNADALEFVS